ncbi:hypothetical protein SDC9_100604 [bioreactor metagenome]|uniref:Uncharacterized protein n=1 Tax=bioreactor metagenome TaxID=1076179 RepID=A0A645AWB2_9ZZZZ
MYYIPCVLRVAVQHGCHLLAGDGGVRVEFPVGAGRNARCVCPLDCGAVPVGRRHIGEGGRGAAEVVAGHPGEDGHKFGPRNVGVRGKCAVISADDAACG